MITYDKIQKLAHNLINYSCDLQEKEKILIEAYDIDHVLINALIQEIYKKKAYPFIRLYNNRVTRELLLNETQELAQLNSKYDSFIMQDMDAYIGVRGSLNTNELCDISSKNLAIHNQYYSFPVHHKIRVNKTKWVILRYPNSSFAQQANMSTDEFENFYFNVCTLDYSKMKKALKNMQELLKQTNKVRILSKNTDIEFSIKNMNSVICSGERNIPDGEIYTVPIKNSVQGVITYNTSSLMQGTKFENISFTFKDGKIVKATSNNTEKLNKILNIDDGARYIGEFSFGVNPYITRPIGDTLFDEKICGSIHFTPGSCYEDCNNNNTSALHWDLVLIQTKEFGGGEIYFDNKLIRKDGIFVHKDLLCLNKENLIN